MYMQNPPKSYKAVTLDADFVLPAVCIYVGGDGDVSAVTSTGETVVFSGVVAGLYIVGQFTKVNTTGTTATNLLYGHN